MIVFTCPNCNRVAIPTMRAGRTIVEIQCKCEAVHRITVTQLHDGKPIDHANREAELAYTYDADHNRITLAAARSGASTALSNVSRPAVAAK